MQYSRLRKAFVSIKVYSDSSFASILDLSFQLGSIVLLSEKHKKFQPVLWTLYNSNPVSLSVLRSKIMAFSHSFNMFCTVRYGLQSMTTLKIPIPVMRDRLSLFYILTKTSMTTIKTLIIYHEEAHDRLKNC